MNLWALGQLQFMITINLEQIKYIIEIYLIELFLFKKIWNNHHTDVQRNFGNQLLDLQDIIISWKIWEMKYLWFRIPFLVGKTLKFKTVEDWTYNVGMNVNFI